MDQTSNFNQMPNNCNPFFNNMNTNYNFNLNQNMFFNQMNQMQNQMNQFQMPNQMNQNEMQNQMIMQMQMMNNLMQTRNNDQNKENQYEDVYKYINEEKKRIIFLRIDNGSYKVLVPCSLRKNELYSTAQNYKKFYFSEIQLFHKGRFMNEDETTIDCVNDGDEIKIIEQLHGVDFSYYDLYLLKHKNEPIINITFNLPNGLKKVLRLTNYTSIKEMIKILLCEINIPENKARYFSFLFNGQKLNIFDESSLIQKNIYIGHSILVIDNRNIGFIIQGKILNVLLKKKNNNIEIDIGTLNTINDFENELGLIPNNGKIIIIKINGKEIQNNDKNKTFSSLGIRENFTCNLNEQEKYILVEINYNTKQFYSNINYRI